MFDLAWSEIALIGVVALVAIGPKDLPEAIRGLARGVQKLRRMAGEFQSQADELVREANLEEVRSSINEIRSFNIRNTIEKAVDSDGTIRKTFTEDPLRTDYGPTPPADAPSPTSTGQVATVAGPESEAPAPSAAPAFIPPAYAPPAPPPVAAAEPPAAPAVVPPPAAPAADPAPTHKT
ncbi:Sec-independent protein translocase protein TatB [Roseicella aquatilis]|uniref:Sec-independent protein translocase protein TatB n=1 Tax=Roseicella aquatilis TaxID=2527868 RepID=UPI0014045E7E|nr:Sec-independent protein translocase protein TatB [Roseicella aquatilis]